jgi:hypothetical protein
MKQPLTTFVVIYITHTTCDVNTFTCALSSAGFPNLLYREFPNPLTSEPSKAPGVSMHAGWEACDTAG